MSEERAEGEGDLRAAEYTLGVLDAQARTAAEVRMASDPAFAAEVARWEALLAPLADGIPEQEPSAGVWRGVSDRIEAGAPPPASRPPPGPVAARPFLARPRTWWGAGVAAAAAVLALAILLPRSSQPDVVMAARLAAPTAAVGSGAVYVANLDLARGDLVVTPAMARPIPGRVPELWLIPDGGGPIPLGLVAFDRPTRFSVASGLGSPGRVTLAVSIEPPGGSPTGKPTGPVVALGKLKTI